LLTSLPATRHLVWREEPPLTVRVKEPTLGGSIEIDVVAQCGERIVDEATIAVDIARIVCDDPWDLSSFGEIHERTGEGSFGTAGVVQLHLDGESIAEYVAPFVERAASIGAIAGPEGGRNGAGCRSRERDETSTQLDDFAPGDV